MAAQTEYYEDEEETPVRTAAEDVLPHSEASIVPADSIAGRALLAVIAIMTFLAALTLGGVVLVRSAAGDWQSRSSCGHRSSATSRRTCRAR
jgi:cell division transport system permease protein